MKPEWPEVSVVEEFNPERVKTVLSIPSNAGISVPRLNSASVPKEVVGTRILGSQKSSRKILMAISGNSKITTAELAEMLGISRRAVAGHVAKLQASGALRRVGPDNGGHWEVLP